MVSDIEKVGIFWTLQKFMLEGAMRRRFSCRTCFPEVIRFYEDPPHVGTTVHEAKRTTMFFKESRTGLNHETLTDDSEARNDFWDRRKSHVSSSS